MDHRDKLVILNLNKKDMECSCFFTRHRNDRTKGFWFVFCNTEKKYSGEKYLCVDHEVPCAFLPETIPSQHCPVKSLSPLPPCHSHILSFGLSEALDIFVWEIPG